MTGILSCCFRFLLPDFACYITFVVVVVVVERDSNIDHRSVGRKIVMIVYLFRLVRFVRDRLVVVVTLSCFRTSTLLAMQSDHTYHHVYFYSVELARIAATHRCTRHFIPAFTVT